MSPEPAVQQRDVEYGQAALQQQMEQRFEEGRAGL